MHHAVRSEQECKAQEQIHKRRILYLQKKTRVHVHEMREKTRKRPNLALDITPENCPGETERNFLSQCMGVNM